MENFADGIERLLIKKHDTYRCLVALLEQERRAIVDMDVAAIWKTVTRKKEIGKTIEALRNSMLCLLEQQGLDHSMEVSSFSLTKVMSLFSVANGKKARFSALKEAINTDKSDAARFAFENQSHVQERLKIINNLVATLVPRPESVSYDGKRSERAPARANCFINKAV